jgi:hypothetical protein
MAFQIVVIQTDSVFAEGVLDLFGGLELISIMDLGSWETSEYLQHGGSIGIFLDLSDTALFRLCIAQAIIGNGCTENANS